MLLRSLHHRCRHHCVVATPSLHRCFAVAALLLPTSLPMSLPTLLLSSLHGRCRHHCAITADAPSLHRPANVAAAIAAPSLMPSLCLHFPRRCAVIIPVAAPLLRICWVVAAPCQRRCQRCCRRRCAIAAPIVALLLRCCWAVTANVPAPNVPASCPRRCQRSCPSQSVVPANVAASVAAPSLPPSLCRAFAYALTVAVTFAATCHFHHCQG